MNTLKFWLKPGFYHLILNPLALVSWMCICRNWSVQVTMFKLDHCPLSRAEEQHGWRPLRASHPAQTGNSRSCNNSPKKCCLTSSEGLFPSFHEGGTEAIVINYANCCNSVSEAVTLTRFFLSSVNQSCLQCTNSDSLFPLCPSVCHQ